MAYAKQEEDVQEHVLGTCLGEDHTATSGDLLY
jgi:hypothetical protein